MNSSHMNMDRRKFLKLLTTASAAISLHPPNLLSDNRGVDGGSGNGPHHLNLQYLEQQLYNFGCPYDLRYFDASPMVTYSEKEKGFVGIMPKGNDSLEVKLYMGDKDASECNYKEINMGPSRLRTETAGLVACHTINLLNQ